MGLNKTFQNLQNGHAQLLDMMILMVDENRLPQTEVSYPKWPFEDALFRQIIELIPSPSKIKNAVFVDTIPGLKALITPVVTGSSKPFYLIGGVLVEEGTVEIVKKYLLEHPEGVHFVDHLEMFPIVSKEEKEEILSAFQQFSESIQSIYQSQQRVDVYQRKTAKTEWVAEQISNERLNLELLLHQFKELRAELDFIGLAVQKEHEKYVIQHFLDSSHAAVKGKEITLGEGFLGQVIVTEEYSYWTNIQEDPRLLPYKECGLFPRSLFCQPIKIGGQMNALLFGGSEKEEAQFDVTDIRHLASLIGIFLNQQTLKDSLNNHLLQLSTLNEIFSAMTNVENMKRVLYILIDMGMNILSGSFACVLYKDMQEESKLSILSRGMKNEFLNHYGRDLGKRYFGRENVEGANGVFYQHENGSLVYEMPITFRNQVFGVLSIGVQNEEEVIPYIPFLSSIGIAGGISISLLEKEHAPQSDEKMIRVLTKLLEKQQPAKYEQSMQAIELVGGFGQQMGLAAEQIHAIKNAIVLSSYEEEIWHDSIVEKETKDLMEQYYRADEVDHVAHKILLILLHHTGVKLDPRMKDDLLLHKFEEWESRSHMVEMVIPLEEQVAAGLEEEEIKEKLNLSNREMEVLAQVLNGLNNRDIAQSLFISDHTVKNHMTNILQKLGVTDRAQAIAKVYQMGYTPK
ncbi:LuxR C-terminal-related transcriptional regulator [Bacillus yapensis]|nr:LuxR C-terminal-related transcriptional regulator [Bacillus yapensis]